MLGAIGRKFADHQDLLLSRRWAPYNIRTIPVLRVARVRQLLLQGDVLFFFDGFRHQVSHHGTLLHLATVFKDR